MCIVHFSGDGILHFLSNLIYCQNMFIAKSGAVAPSCALDTQTLDHTSPNNKDLITGMPSESILWVEKMKAFC